MGGLFEIITNSAQAEARAQAELGNKLLVLQFFFEGKGGFHVFYKSKWECI